MGRHLHATGSRPRSPTPPWRVLEAPAGAVRVLALRRRVLRPDLDEHRPAAGRRATACSRLIGRIEPDVPGDVPVVALEPSCLAVLRVDSAELLAAVPRRWPAGWSRSPST